MIEVKNLSKHYGAKKAVDDISFTVKDGEIVGFLGPNGAGKTTTMNIITGYISPTSGEVIIDGKNTMENSREARKNIGYLPEQPPLYADMTVREYLDFVFDLKRAEGDKALHIDSVCEKVRIKDVSGRLIKNLSKGYKQRVGLAEALIGNPKILILDEPTVGLDPGQIIEIRNLIKELGKNHTVILSSHILSEISAVCDDIIIINGGKIVASDKTENLSKTRGKENRYIVRIKGDKTAVIEALRGVSGILRVNSKQSPEEGAYDYGIEADRDIREYMFGILASCGMPILGLRPREMSLEETFMRITAGEVQ